MEYKIPIYVIIVIINYLTNGRRLFEFDCNGNYHIIYFAVYRYIVFIYSHIGIIRYLPTYYIPRKNKYIMTNESSLKFLETQR